MAHVPQGVFKLTVRMQRDSPNIPWGFRMQGGSDFTNVPLSIAKVTPGSLAEEVGLQPGDVITAVGDPPNPAIHWTHAEAEQVIRQCFDYLVVTIQRGGGRTWEIGRTAAADLPQSSGYPLNSRNAAASTISAALPGASKYGGGSVPAYSQNTGNTYVQHSLAANKQEALPIGAGHNRTAKPFSGAAATYSAQSPIIHNPYNSPMGLYSQNNAMDAYNAHASVLLGPGQGGTTGPSATQQAVSQMDQYGDQYGGSFGNSANNRGQTGGAYGSNNGATSPSIGGQSYQYSNVPIRSVQAPQTMSPEHYQQPINQVPKCAMCQSSIVGVFVRVRGQPMCVGCYKCAKCNIPLKTIGHFVVDDQLYCEQHAKQLTRPGYDGYQSSTVYSS
ncbi:hypothetical protein RvY_08644 [Ramazzottius varieornatus]|uniref:PDZ and LIM domain protein Zasp n=1 Tax=Ramazzottius varieornatus TaxID=947166 RepID=A0A1D1V957_RAMVA|nr:hypothetical protein RvY_08644 [Ramazzottius varieornatus]